jgi:hypothetical protein
VFDTGTDLLTGADAQRAAVAEPESLEANPKRCIDHGEVWLRDRVAARRDGPARRGTPCRAAARTVRPRRPAARAQGGGARTRDQTQRLPSHKRSSQSV